MHESKLGFVVKRLRRGGSGDAGTLPGLSRAGDTDLHRSAELQTLRAVEGGDEVRADLGAGNVHPGSKVTSRDASLQAQGSGCRKERLGRGEP